MPIEHTNGGTVITGDSLDYFALCTQKAAVAMELHGLRVRRGTMVWKRLRDHYKLGKATKQQVYDWLAAKVEELRAQQEHVVVEDGRVKREVGGQEVQ